MSLGCQDRGCLDDGNGKNGWIIAKVLGGKGLRQAGAPTVPELEPTSASTSIMLSTASS